MSNVLGSKPQSLRNELIHIPLGMLIGLVILLILSYVIGFGRDPIFQEPWVVANNSLSMAVLFVSIILSIYGEWRTSFALGVILAEVSRNLYVLLFFTLNRSSTDAQSFQIQALFMSIAFIAIIMSIGVGRTAGFIIGNLAIISYALAVWFYPAQMGPNGFFTEYAVIVGGGCLVTHYFRTYLLRLMHMRQETLRRLQGFKESAEKWGEEFRPYITFGRNTAGLIHDFRNYVHVLTTNTQVQLLRLGKGKELDPESIKAIQKKLSELSDRIALVTFATQHTDEDVIEDLVVQDLVRSVIYPFTISKEIRLNVELISRVAPGLVLRSSRQHILRILENLVRNSCEAIMETMTPQGNSQAINVLGKVTVEAGAENGGCYFVVLDTGPGLKTCSECSRHQSCMDCNLFKIGKTTKSYGSGWGMVNVRERIRELGGNLQIQSQLGLGTQIRIWMPHYRKKLLNPENTGVTQAAFKE